MDYILYFIVLFFLVLVLSRKLNRKFCYGGVVSGVDFFSPFLFFPVAYLGIYFLGGVGWLYFDKVEGIAVAVLLGLVGYYFGIFIASTFKLENSHSSTNSNYEFSFLLFLFLFFSVFTIYIFSKAGIPLLMPDVENARTSLVTQVGGFVYYMYRSLPIVAVLFFSYYLVHDRQRQVNFLAKLFVGISFALVIMSAYRGHLIAPLLTMLIVFHYLKREIRFFEFLVIFLVGISLFAFFGAVRLASTGSENAEFIYRLIVELRNPPRALSMILENYPSVYSYYNGEIITSSIMVVFSDASAYGLQLKEQLGLNFQGGGFTPSILGSFVLDFGYISLFLGMASVGFILMFFFRKMTNSDSHFDVVVYAFLCQYMVVCIRGGFLQEILPIWYILIVLMLKYACSSSRRASKVLP